MDRRIWTIAIVAGVAVLAVVLLLMQSASQPPAAPVPAAEEVDGY